MVGIVISGSGGGADPSKSSTRSNSKLTAQDRQDRRDFVNYRRREDEIASRQQQDREARERDRRNQAADSQRSRVEQERRARQAAAETSRQRRDEERRSRAQAAEQVRQARAAEAARRREQAERVRADRTQQTEAHRLNRIYDRQKTQEARSSRQHMGNLRRAADEEDAIRTARNPGTYLNQYLGSLRSRATATMGNRDFGALKQIDADIKQVNETLKSRLSSGAMSRGEYVRSQNNVASAQAAVLAARSIARPGIGGLAGRMAGGVLLARNSNSRLGSLLAGEGAAAGPWGAVASMAGQVLMAGATAPQTIASGYSRWMANSARSRWLSHNAMDLGIQNGISGSFDNIRSVFHRRGSLHGWQARYGVDDVQALQMVQRLGMPLSSTSGIQSAAQLLASVPYQSGLMGMTSQGAASILNQGHTLGLSAANARVSGAVAGNNAGFNIRGGFNARSDQAYLNRFGRVMRQAFAEGLDSSQVATTMTSLVGMAATSGQGYTNANGAFRLASGLMASGDASMRSGAGILSFQAGINNATRGIGFGGDSTRNTVFHNYFARHGGVPRSMSDLRRLGVQTQGLTGAQRANLNDALRAFRSGNEASGLSLLQPFLSGENGAGILHQVGADEAQYLPGSMRPLFMRNFMGVGTSQYYDYEYGRQYNAARKRGTVDDRARALSQQTGVGAQTLADLWAYETNNRSVRGGAGNRYYGVGQVGAEGLADLKRRFPREFGQVSLSDLQKNPELGRAASARYMQLSLSENRGDIRAGVNQYLGMHDGGSYTPYQTQERDTLISDMAARPGDVSDTLRYTNAAESAAGNAATDASEQAHEFAPIMARAADSMAKLSGQVDNLTRKFAQLGSQMMGGIGMVPPRIH